MRLTFFGNYLNHHQVFVADELFRLLGEEFKFVATLPKNDGELKGGVDYSVRSYCLQAAESEASRFEAVRLAKESDVCIFGACSQEYAVLRAKSGNNGLSFEVGERRLKRGWINILSPVLLRWWINYWRYYRKNPFYKLCASAFASDDDEKLGCYCNRHYKWGYFTAPPDSKGFEASRDVSKLNVAALMWCSRYLVWKHPEMPLLMAERLKRKGFKFMLDMYGSGECEPQARLMAEKLGVNDVVRFVGNKPNHELMADMRDHDIFLFTSDRNEGWGAVANESMANGCALVGSDAIGAVPYLVTDGVNGCTFTAPSPHSGFSNPDMNALDSLCNRVEWLLNNPQELMRIRRTASEQMQKIWSPANAASNLLRLIDDLANNREPSITIGPCSKT